MQVVTKVAEQEEPVEGSLDAAAAGDIARWLRGEAQADAVRITTFERLPGGAIQDNCATSRSTAARCRARMASYCERTHLPACP